MEEGFIKEEVFAQTGSSTYIPRNYNYTKFLDPKEFNRYIESCRLVISHGGTGSIICALTKGKNVIGVTRLSKYKEHIDDHQKQIVELFTSEHYLYGIEEMDELKDAIAYFNEPVTMKRFDKESCILTILEDYIKKNI